MNRTILALALLAPATAVAWNPLTPRSAWFFEDMPIPYVVADYHEDSLEVGEQETVVVEAYARWDAASCAQMETVYGGLVEENTGFERGDNINRVNWDDLESDLEVGVLAAATPYSAPGSPTRSILGQLYRQQTDGDVIYNNNVKWGNEDTIQNDCDAHYSVVAVGVHEYGHWWGLGHTCEETDACTDPSDLNATMYWSVGPCDNGPANPTDNDLDGVTALYGPSSQVQCSHELNPGAEDTISTGVAPMDIRCTVTQRGDDTFSVTDAEWFFGDGTETQTGLSAVHTYEEAGTYTINVTVSGTSDQCGPWDADITRESYVRVCGLADIGMDIEHIDGRRYQLLNQTDLSATGCIYRVQWDIFNPDGLLEASIPTWEPEYEFEMNGEYRLVLNVGGPAGTAAHELNVVIRNRRGAASACDTVGAGALGTLALLLPLAIRRRRE